MPLTAPALPLETERLVLRDYQAADWRAVHGYARGEEFYRFLPIEPPTAESTRAFIEGVLGQQRRRPRLTYSLLAELQAERRPIGDVSLRLGGGPSRTADIGYAFDPAIRGRGYAIEAVSRVVALGFGHFGLHRISAVCDPDNAGSIRVLERLGMRREGVLRENLLIRGKRHDSLLYAMLASDFRG